MRIRLEREDVQCIYVFIDGVPKYMMIEDQYYEIRGNDFIHTNYVEDEVEKAIEKKGW